MLLERPDVCTATLATTDQAPLSLAISKGHDEVVKILRGNSDSRITGHSVLAPLPPPSGNGCRRMVDLRSRSHDPNINTTDLGVQHAPPPADPEEWERALDLENPVSEPADNDLPTIKPSVLPQSPPTFPVGPLDPPAKTATRPDITRSPLSLVPNRYFLIASLICLLAFLFCVPPTSLPHIFSSHTDNPRA